MTSRVTPVTTLFTTCLMLRKRTLERLYLTDKVVVAVFQAASVLTNLRGAVISFMATMFAEEI